MKHEEDDHQKAVIQWASMARINGIKVGDYLFAIPNGGKRNPREAARLKAQGVKAGVSDLFLPIPMYLDGFSGLWIEMKAEKGTVTPLQAEWGIKMMAQGYEFKICYGATEAIAAIEEYLSQ